MLASYVQIVTTEKQRKCTPKVREIETSKMIIGRVAKVEAAKQHEVNADRCPDRQPLAKGAVERRAVHAVLITTTFRCGGAGSARAFRQIVPQTAGLRCR